MQMAAPPDNDPRWSFELAGGALMDLGCYALHAQRQFGRWTSGEPTIVSAAGGERAGRPGVDEWMRVELVFPGGLPGTVTVNMAATGERSMPWTITCDRGSVTAPSWPVQHLDDRVILTTAAGTVVESLGTRTSYTYQLEAFASSLRGGGPSRSTWQTPWRTCGWSTVPTWQPVSRCVARRDVERVAAAIRWCRPGRCPTRMTHPRPGRRPGPGRSRPGRRRRWVAIR